MMGGCSLPLADSGSLTGAMTDLAERLPDVPELVKALEAAGYLADEPLGTALFLALRMGQPILLEGEPGVGKTEAAKALAVAAGTPLIRLQCYEGLTSAEALYEWNYPRQLLAIRLAEARGETPAEADLFSEEFLLKRPLLAALDHPGPRPAVLLIDEVDRGDDEFEAFLFELLAEAAVTIPELGTRRAAHPPIVVLTSNRTRDLHDALKRRCLYHWIDYPDSDRVAAIIRRRVPGAAVSLTEQVAATVARLRELDLAKPPGVAEAISWASALHVLGAPVLDAAAAQRTAGAVLKYAEDLNAVRAAGFAGLIGPDAVTDGTGRVDGAGGVDGTGGVEKASGAGGSGSAGAAGGSDGPSRADGSGRAGANGTGGAGDSAGGVGG
jgi:MoxR-like ATPase